MFPVSGHAMLILSRRHDNVAELLGITAASFEQSQKDAVMGMRRTFLEYVHRLKQALSSGGTAVGKPEPLVKIICDEAGWPQLVGFDPAAKHSKTALEDTIRAYLSKHYGACKG